MRRNLDALAQAAIRRTVSLLPARSLRYILASIAARTGVSLIQVDGNRGQILGAIDDQVVFGCYWRGLDPSSALISSLQTLSSINRGGTLVDVGANIGLFTTPFARNPKIACKLFEPDRLNSRLLRWNLATNCPGADVSIYELALLDRKCTVELEHSPDNHGDHRVRVGDASQASDRALFRENERETAKVPATTLDDLLNAETLAKPIVIKIDVQGAEAHVIQGGSTLLKSTDILIFEFWPYGLRRAHANVPQMFDQLKAVFREGALFEEKDGTPRCLEAEGRPLRSIDLILADLHKLYHDVDSIRQVDVLLRR